MLQRCREYLIKKINAENCVRLLSFADLFSCEELKQSAKRMVEHKFTAVYHQEAFMQLSHDLLIDILSSDNLNVEKEETKFFVLGVIVHCCLQYSLSFKLCSDGYRASFLKLQRL